MTLSVAVLMGGQSAEAEVSRNSAQQVSTALGSKGHAVTLVEVDDRCAATLLDLQPQVVFPALHGPPGEDGTIQGFLEVLGLPYVGSGVHGSALAMDKAVTKALVSNLGLPVLPDRVVEHLDADIVSELLSQFGERVVIKPLNQGSAIGVVRLPNGGDLAAALTEALQFGPCLVEPYTHANEITAGVLQKGDELIPHPVIEITTASDSWYDFENRYKPGASEHIIPARLSASTLAKLQDIAVSAHRILGLRDLSRTDFLVTDEEEIYFLEVNSLPGMTPTSLYPDGARHLGYDFPELMDFLVQQAWSRAQA